MSRVGDMDVLELVLRPPATPASPDLPAFLRDSANLRGLFSRPIDRAIAGAAVADRLGYAFSAGYQAALTALVPSLDPLRVASFCVTEPNGNHPRAIETQLEISGGSAVLTGEKRWSTMAPLADVLVIVAKEGMDSEGRPRLRAVLVPGGAPGLDVREMPPPPFVSEVPHAEISMRGVRVPEDRVLPGDGYTEYSKAFRTVEDLHVNASVLAYLMGVAGRYGFPPPLRERGAALLLSAREIALRDPKRPETHIALAGLLELGGRLVAEMEAEWERADDAERALWQRDRALVQVAGKAREQRRNRAWHALLSASDD